MTTNENIYSLFEDILINENSAQRIVSISPIDIKRGWFVARINIIKVNSNPEKSNNRQDVYFNPIILKFPSADIELSKAEFHPIGMGQLSQMSNIKKSLDAGIPVVKKAVFKLRMETAHEKSIPVVNQISTLLLR